MIVSTITQTNILTKLLTKIMLTRNANARSTNVNARSTNVNARSTNVNARSTNVNARSTNVNARSTNVSARSTNVNARTTVEERRFQRRVPCTDVMRASAPVVALLSSNPSLSTPLKN